jgi:hypothetical protein
MLGPEIGNKTAICDKCSGTKIILGEEKNKTLPICHKCHKEKARNKTESA